MRLLLVEDDPDTVESITLCLKIYQPSLQLDSTTLGEKAISLLKENQYDGAIVDLGLPDIDGIELIRELRSFSQIRLVVISAISIIEVIKRAMANGANDYVIKPFNHWELLNRLQKQFHIL